MDTMLLALLLPFKMGSPGAYVERDSDIELSAEYTLRYWLGDVVLRFEKSRHLSADQKQLYYDSIEKIREEIESKANKQPTQRIPQNIEAALIDLRQAVSQSDRDHALNLVAELEKLLSRRVRGQDPITNVFSIYRRLYQRSPMTFSVVAVIVIVLYFGLLWKYILPFTR